jgi:exoribonuclease R
MGGSIRLGDEVKVIVKAVDLDRKQIDFEIF